MNRKGCPSKGRSSLATMNKPLSTNIDRETEQTTVMYLSQGPIDCTLYGCAFVSTWFSDSKIGL